MEPERVESPDKRQAAELPSAVSPGVPLRGQVSRLNQARRYAFIRLATGREVYMHWSALKGLRFAELRPDQEVECWLANGGAGLQAVRVRRWGVQRRRRLRIRRRGGRE